MDAGAGAGEGAGAGAGAGGASLVHAARVHTAAMRDLGYLVNQAGCLASSFALVCDEDACHALAALEHDGAHLAEFSEALHDEDECPDCLLPLLMLRWMSGSVHLFAHLSHSLAMTYQIEASADNGTVPERAAHPAPARPAFAAHLVPFVRRCEPTPFL
jgi:hypothetical protein